MDYSSKKQSWLEFLNGTMGNNIKGEAMDRNFDVIQSAQTNNNNYIRFNPDIAKSNLNQPKVRNPVYEKAKKMYNKQQQQNPLPLINRK
jgi:hypothetical protein